MTHRIVEATEAAHFALARNLFQEYATGLGTDLCFQNFAAELDDLPAHYGPPSGCLLLLMRDAAAVGCGGIRAQGAGVCEMKRLYIQRGERGAKQGRRLVVQLAGAARRLGHHTLRLDTLPSMTAARCLYVSLGFRTVAPYYVNPLPGTLYMELDLRHPEFELGEAGFADRP